MIISKHRKRPGTGRFNSAEFKGRIRAAAGYRRLFPSVQRFWVLKFFIRTRIGRVIAIIILIVAAYYLFFSSTLRITSVSVAGNNQIGTDQIANVIIGAGRERIFLISRNHFLLMSRGYTNNLLTRQLPMIKEVTKTDRTWPNQIKLEIVERNKGFVLKTNGQNYLVDEEGMVVRTFDDAFDLLLVQNQIEENVAIGEILNPKMSAFIISIGKQWDAKINTKISEALIGGLASQEVQFGSIEGWSVIFDINRSALSQLSNLALILNKQIPAKDRSRLAYVDLRLEKWAYYCYKSSPCEAQPQQNVPE